MKLNCRKYQPDIDENFVFSSWLRSARTKCDFQKMPNSVFFPNYKKLIESCISKNSTIIVCSEDDPDHILGFMTYCLSGDLMVIYYAYTKFTYRKMGIFKKMLLEAFAAQEGCIFISHRSETTDKISNRYGLIYNPFIFWREK